MTLFAQAYQPTFDRDLFRDMRPILTSSFTINQPGRLYVSGHVDTHHRGMVDGVVMVAFQLQLDGLWLPGSKTGVNILSETDHYESSPIHGFAELAQGVHDVVLFGRSASTLADKDGLAEVKASCSEMLVRVDRRD